MQFVYNEGALIASTADDILHYWTFRTTKKPEVVQSLKFQRERYGSNYTSDHILVAYDSALEALYKSYNTLRDKPIKSQEKIEITR